KPYAQTLARLGVEESELKTIFQQNDLQVGSILVQDGQYQFNLRFLSELKKPEDIEDLYFKIKGSFFRLGDLAEVTYTEAAPRGLFKKNAVNGIVMSVRKQAEGNLFDLKRDMDILLADMEVTYKGLEFELSNDQSNLLRVSIDNLLSSLGYGALFAILILVAFFREWRAPLLIGLAVPIALVIALFGFSLIGITINTISLAGLILGVGLMVDNSIIVIENIRQYRRQGFSNSEAGVKGTVEVMRPLLSSALTTCSVFLPLIFLSGLAGALFYDQAISVSLALGASLLVAWLVLPTISRLVEKSESISVQPPKKAGWFERSVDGVLANKWLVLTGFAGLLGLLIYLLQVIPKDRFPELSRQGAEVVIDWNEPLNIKENNGRYLQIFQAFSDITVSSNGFIGRQQFLLDAEQQSEQELKLMMISPDHWKTLVKEVPAFVRAQWPKAQVTATPLKNVFDQVFGEKKAPLIVHFKSQTSNDMPKQEVVEPVLYWLTQQGYNFSSPANQFQYGLEIDRTAALRFQVTVADIEARVRSLLNQEPIGKLRMETNAIPVVLRLNEDNLQVNLDQTLIRNRVGDQIPLNRFIRFIPESTYKMVTATRTGPTYNLEMTAYDPGLETKIRSRLRDEGLLAAFFSGSYFSDQALIQELIWVLGISLLLLYLIL
ncbi:MAG: efflux RND transporter permease subunit, partial [Saprospiraceae bacterium]|nr:efflux RND transporter permease subunit [Saprospiraceae bacterium]